MGSTQRRSEKGLIAVIVVGVVLVYLAGFHGEYHSSYYEDGMRYTKTQYFGTIKLYGVRGSDPEGLPEHPPSPKAVLGEARFWRGFGLLWQRKKNYR